MPRQAANMQGLSFGRLTVIERAGSDDLRCAIWRCECTCGGEIAVRGYSLRRGHTRSCGCLVKEYNDTKEPIYKYKSVEEATWVQKYLTYMHNAAKRGQVFDIALDEFIDLELVRLGAARYEKRFFTRYADVLLQAQTEARAANKGMWSTDFWQAFQSLEDAKEKLSVK